MAQSPEQNVHAAEHDAEAYLHGQMAIEEQTRTYAFVMDLTKWGSLVIAVTLTFFTMWLHPNGAFLPALIAAGVLAIAGGLFLSQKPKH